jgi:hypothetical protein
MAPDDGKGCGPVGGVKLTLVDSLGQPLENVEPQFVCNGAVGETGAKGPEGLQGPQGLQGAEGPQGPAGPSAAFRQINIPPFAVTAAPASVGLITFTVPSAGSVLVMGTGLCTLTASTAAAFEIGPQITAANPALGNVFQNQTWISTAAGEQPAYRSIALSRSFVVPSAGAYQLFLNEQRVSAAGSATCYAAVSVFFTASALP